LAKIYGVEDSHVLRIQVYDVDVPTKDRNGDVYYPLTDADAKKIANDLLILKK
jgi:hypothetical protein